MTISSHFGRSHTPSPSGEPPILAINSASSFLGFFTRKRTGTVCILSAGQNRHEVMDGRRQHIRGRDDDRAKPQGFTRRRKESQNAGLSATVSHRALVVELAGVTDRKFKPRRPSDASIVGALWVPDRRVCA